ncbi:MAG: FAD-dependent oxidoreductase [Proteobacteria bacterium]|nr:FAD-dependent oxidoreductase [Pseudomonadota bacterium]
MMKLTRRKFGRLIGAAATAAAGKSLFPKPAVGGAKARVVVVGGGAGGATVARHLAEDFNAIGVTLIEANARYTACFFANRYLGGIRTLDSVTHDYRTLASKYGVGVVHDWATDIDAGKKTVTLKGGGKLAYDRLVMAPGIDFKYDLIDGYGESATETIPHAYKADRGIAVLKRQLEAMKDGGVFVITAPKRPYRCPPAPYERAAMAAYYLKRVKPRSKILILDAKDEFPMSEVMTEAWERYYGDMIEWVPAEFGGQIRAVEVKTKTLITAEEKVPADVANIIPEQQAGRIAQIAGLTDETGWCPIRPGTFESALRPGIHLVGDAIDPGDMSKSAFSANSQARACAAAVGAALTERRPAEPRYTNTCFFLASRGVGLKVGGTYKAKAGRLTGVTGFASQPGEDDDTRKATAAEGEAWYAAITGEMFG